MTNPSFPTGTILGYPRIGPRRELKKAVEAFWAGTLDEAGLEDRAAALRRRTRTRLAELGLGTTDASIPSDFSYYDQVLDAAVLAGAVPARFADLVTDGRLDLAGYFTVARGAGALAPLEMTKWFDSNYHYLVPEIGPDTAFSYADDRPVRYFREALAEGVTTRPVVVGPVTLLLLSKPAEGSPEGFAPLDRLDDLLPVYRRLLTELRAAGAPWVQLDEPALVTENLDVPRGAVLDALARAYRYLATELPADSRPAVFVAAPYGSLDDALPVLAATDVEALGLDLVRGQAPAGTVPGLAAKTVVGGVVDGHNIWRTDLDAALGKLEALRDALGDATIAVSSSTSLFHVPHDAADEPLLDPELRSWLAFADQKVGEVTALATALTSGREAVSAEFAAAAAARASRLAHPGVRRPEVRRRTEALGDDAFRRSAFAARQAAQDAELGLPELPTTTIGSFPQTREIRQARARFRKGELDLAAYTEAMHAEIRRVIELQEKLGLDVLVHGEPERNDMVQYFAEHLDGFATTENGWVQSYGSRCTRPSLLWGDVTRPAPITVEWSTFAQSVTDKPVKGMLTGPVTILAWSFVRDDQPLRETANQVALALRDEIGDLEAAGIKIVQVDEPALRELLPLRKADQADYLDWSVGSFRLATSGAADATQIHTHLCYSEFGEVIGAIDALDADVTSIEAARSKMEILPDIQREGFSRGIGPGVYDIHSPRVPSTDEIEGLLTEALRSVPATQLWVNPDCGLKTRGYDETVPSLEHLVAATVEARKAL